MGKLLDQLRIQRDQRENEIKAPVIKALNNERREKEVAIDKYHQIEFKLGENIIKYAMDRAKYEISLLLSEHLFKVLRNRSDGIFQISLPLAQLRVASPDKQLQLLLTEYARMSRPSLKIEAGPPSERIEVVEISIPQLNIRLPILK